MAAHIIHHETPTPHIPKLGRLITIIPITFTITLIPTFSIPPLPPFNPFLTKHLFFTTIIPISHITFTHLSTSRPV
ncbi:proton-conducting transporter membrane subunit, partial [Bacillus altitudinis]|uniref:proton-conducting transporter transmembrane domain-containing protein n=1 Tax=Bacillus altitudinis TaxID=293387 RepID=UPI00307D6288